MGELCHICDLFRTALFGPTNAEEDHLDQGVDLPRPRADAPADAPATMRQRTRGSGSQVAMTKVANHSHGQADASAQTSGNRTSNLAPAGVTAVRITTSGPTAPSTGSALGTAGGSQSTSHVEAVPFVAAPTPTSADAGGGAKPVPKTKFSKRASRGIKASPAYTSFDDVDVEDDDSDGELFIDEQPAAATRRNHASSRSPGPTAGNAYAVAPSVYRAPALHPVQTPVVAAQPAAAHKAPAEPSGEAPPPPAYNSAAARADVGAGRVTRGDSDMDVERMGDGGVQGEEKGLAGSGGMVQLRSHGAHPGYRMSIPRDPSALMEGARPHAQSITESFHGYKGYPGYEPDTPVNAQLQLPGRSGSTESLTIRAPAAEVERREQLGPTSSSTRRQYQNPRDGGPIPAHSARHKHRAGSMGDDLTEEHHHQHQHVPSISPSGTMEMASVGGESHINLPSATQPQHHNLNPGTGLSYASRSGGVYRPSPANSIASSFRRGDDGRSIPPMPSEDGMGSVLGTIGGAEDAANEDLQWKRSALKKFHKVMVKGEGLRVVKHNRSGGSQVRIIRYDPDIKALVWNSKRYMKKAGSANVPIVGIKRVGREGNTVSVTAAGRGTIGFEPQRIRDAKILAEALRALVDKEERSAMWRG